MTPKLMTVAQAAELCECSPKTLRRAIDSGQLAAIRLGIGPKSDRIHPDDLEVFWKKARFQPGRVELPHVTMPRYPPLDDDVHTRIELLLGKCRKSR